jgi:hypothetical protein
LGPALDRGFDRALAQQGEQFVIGTQACCQRRDLGLMAFDIAWEVENAGQGLKIPDLERQRFRATVGEGLNKRAVGQAKKGSSPVSVRGAQPTSS